MNKNNAIMLQMCEFLSKFLPAQTSKETKQHVCLLYIKPHKINSREELIMSCDLLAYSTAIICMFVCLVSLCLLCIYVFSNYIYDN